MKLRNTLISIPAQGAWLDGLLAHAPDVRGLAVLPQSSGHPALDTGPRPLELALQSRGFATMRLDQRCNAAAHGSYDLIGSERASGRHDLIACR